MFTLASDDTHWLTAWTWIRLRRRHAPSDADIWHLLFHRKLYEDALYRQVGSGNYRLSPMQVLNQGESRKGSQALWSAQDALILKWVSLHVKNSFPVHERCMHLEGHRGGRDSLACIAAAIKDGASFVYRTDIRGYYRNINKQQLCTHVFACVTNPVLRDLIAQYIDYTLEDGGEFYTPSAGICRGASLSPLLGASFLHPIDSTFSRDTNQFYARYRYMDEFIFLSRKRWPVRRARSLLWDFFFATWF